MKNKNASFFKLADSILAQGQKPTVAGEARASFIVIWINNNCNSCEDLELTINKSYLG